MEEFWRNENLSEAKNDRNISPIRKREFVG
jgi:hypothetical protein